MRVGPDTAPHWEPHSDDLSDPGARSAVVTSAGRAFMHGRFWTNDADCLLVDGTFWTDDEMIRLWDAPVKTPALRWGN